MPRQSFRQRTSGHHFVMLLVMLLTSIVVYALLGNGPSVRILLYVVVTLAMETALVELSMFAILRAVLRTERVEVDAIFGAACAYLVMGYAFADLFRRWS